MIVALSCWPGRRRGAAELAGRYLGVLRLDGVDHVGRGQAVADQLVRVEPDAHGVLGAEQRDGRRRRSRG